MKKRIQNQNRNQARAVDLRIDCDVARQIRQHARSSIKTEVCGVLIGVETDGMTTVEACIQGANSLQAGAHVTFTQDTWEHIYRIKDRDYPEARIVGWYHSHPGFGVFLSDHDTFIHKNFFSAPQQIAWVYDPHSDEEGCFGWKGGVIERLPHFLLTDEKGGEMAGETGKPEPLLGMEDQDLTSTQSGELIPQPTEAQAALRTGLVILSYLAVLAIGFAGCWFLYPKYVPVPFDPNTGQLYLPVPSPSGGQPTFELVPAPQVAPSAPLPAPAAQPSSPPFPQQPSKGKP